MIMGYDKATSLAYHTGRLARLFQATLYRHIRPLGLSPGAFPALLELARTDGLTQRQLVALLEIEQATVANTLVRMERDGLIVRKPHPDDRRAQTIWLTRRARMLMEEAVEAVDWVNDRAMADFSNEERDQFVDLTKRAITSLKSERSLPLSGGAGQGSDEAAPN